MIFLYGCFDVASFEMIWALLLVCGDVACQLPMLGVALCHLQWCASCVLGCTPRCFVCCCRRDLETGKIIDTVSVQRAAAMIRPWIEHMEPFILVGPEGCGKSMLISHMVRYPVITVPYP